LISPAINREKGDAQSPCYADKGVGRRHDHCARNLIVVALGAAVVISSLIDRVEKLEADLDKAQIYRLAERPPR
jgi:hypothetical protein